MKNQLYRYTEKVLINPGHYAHYVLISTNVLINKYLLLCSTYSTYSTYMYVQMYRCTVCNNANVYLSIRGKRTLKL